MTPIPFKEANTKFGPPSDLDEVQCGSIPAYLGTVQGGSVDGCKQVVVAWQPSAQDLERLQAGEPLFISMIGGLLSHYPSTSFHEATHPA